MSSSDSAATIDAASIGGRLRELRKQRDMTQAELARQIGIQQSDLSRIEKGAYRVSLDNLFKILAVFDLQISDFFSDLRRSAAARQPLSQHDMRVLQLLRELSPEARDEIQQFIEFKVRRERAERRAVEARAARGTGS